MQSVKFKRTDILILAQADLFMQGQHTNYIEFLTGETEKHKIQCELIQFHFESGTVLSNKGQNPSQKEVIKNVFSQRNIGLCCIFGNPFYHPEINNILARELEDGMRILLFSDDIEYKHLAEYLGVSNIKHKARIEKIRNFNNDDDNLPLLSSIFLDELRRLTS